VPGASETSSKPYVWRRSSTFDRKTRRVVSGDVAASGVVEVVIGA
jgi:hypothetical protein